MIAVTIGLCLQARTNPDSGHFPLNQKVRMLARTSISGDRYRLSRRDAFNPYVREELQMIDARQLDRIDAAFQSSRLR